MKDWNLVYFNSTMLSNMLYKIFVPDMDMKKLYKFRTIHKTTFNQVAGFFNCQRFKIKQIYVKE